MPQHVHALRLLCTAVHQRLQRQALFLCQALCISLQASCLQAGIYLLPVQTLSDPDASQAWQINHSAPVVPCRRPRILTVFSWCRRGHTPPSGFCRHHSFMPAIAVTSNSGNCLPRRDARLKIPSMALTLKKYLVGGSSASIAASVYSAPALGHSPVLRVDKSVGHSSVPCKAPPTFRAVEQTDLSR